MTVAELHQALTYLVANGRGAVEIFSENRPVVSVSMSVRVIRATLITKAMEEPPDADMMVEVNT